MTKDEFLSMLSEELENLEEERKAAIQRANYLEMTSLFDEDKTARYQVTLIQKKISTLKDFLHLPAYARIQAMSDIEVEEYKKEKVEELELEIKEIESRKEQAKAKSFQLRAEQEQLMNQFESLSGIERDRAIDRGVQLSIEINRYDVKSDWGVFASLDKEIEEIRKQQEQIKAMISQDVKQQLSSEIEVKYRLGEKIERSENPLSSYGSLFSPL